MANSKPAPEIVGEKVQPDAKLQTEEDTAECGSVSIAKSFQSALVPQDASVDTEPPLKDLCSDFGKWRSTSLPKEDAPLSVQRAVMLLDRPALKQKITRRKSVSDLPTASATHLLKSSGVSVI